MEEQMATITVRVTIGDGVHEEQFEDIYSARNDALTQEEAVHLFGDHWNSVRDEIRAKSEEYGTDEIAKGMSAKGWNMQCISPRIDVEVND